MAALAQAFDPVELGPPDARLREEAWRYSKAALRALAQQAFVPAASEAEIPADLRARYEWPQTQGRRLVFVNGVLSARHSRLESRAPWRIDTSAAGAYRLEIDGDSGEPLHVVHVGVPGATPSRWQVDLDWRVHAGEAGVIEQHVAAPGALTFGIVRQRIALASSSHLQWVGLGDLPESAALCRADAATLAAHSRLGATQVLLGGRMQRLAFDAVLAGERAQLAASGAFALRGREQTDVWLDVRHAARATVCDLRWRGVADGRSRGAFRGGIHVEEGADGSDARLANGNLLLSAQAEIDARPVLEIHADEVKAAHGATVGQLDERALFYLRSRGIAREEARRMLIGAFSAAALDRVAWPWLRERLAEMLAMRVQGEGE